MKEASSYLRLRVGTALLFLLLVPACQGTSTTSEQRNGQELGRAPEFQLRNLDGDDVRFSDFAGQVAVVNFWASWCAPCRIEIPHLIELYSRYRSQGLVILGIAVDSAGTQGLRELVHEMAMNYPVLIADDQVVADYGGIFGIPATFVIDREGLIRNRHVGLAKESLLEEEILGLLRK
jgi:thiol-disulfide isomerase/thioredoxin